MKENGSVLYKIKQNKTKQKKKPKIKYLKSIGNFCAKSQTKARRFNTNQTKASRIYNGTFIFKAP